MRRANFLLVGAVMLVGSSAHADDLLIWWPDGFYEEENRAVLEVVEAYEAETGSTVEVTFHPFLEVPKRIEALPEGDRLPDIAFGFTVNQYAAEWALEGRLADIADVIEPFAGMFEPEALERGWLPGRDGKRSFYALPMGRSSDFLHVWTSLLEQAGFSLDDVPKDWDAFWSFWCDQAQPAVREATGRDDVYGVGLAMSPDGSDTRNQLLQFFEVHGGTYVTPEGELMIDDPAVRRAMIRAVVDYVSIYERGCAPPGATEWKDLDNNRSFVEGESVLTPNETLSTVNMLKHERPEDYYENTQTIEWPDGPDGDPFPIMGNVFMAVVLDGGAQGRVDLAKRFISFLVGEGWLMHYLNFSAERMLPVIGNLAEMPFWLDPDDPHRMAAAIQVASRPLLHDYATASGNWRHDMVEREVVWGEAVHRVVTEGISPEQAVDEAIQRIKQILAE